MKAIIMAGGRGARLQPYTHVLPKPLIPLGDLPILEIIVKQLVYYGFTHLTITLGYAASLIENYFGDGERWGIHIDYTWEQQPMGTAGALGLITSVDEPFLLMNADILTDLNFRQFYLSHKDAGEKLTVLLHEQVQSCRYGVIEVAEDGTLREYKEKPEHTFLISTGIYMLEPNVLRYIDTQGMDMPELIRLTSRRYKIRTELHQGIWKDIGTPEHVREAAQLFQSERDRFLPVIGNSG